MVLIPAWKAAARHIGQGWALATKTQSERSRLFRDRAAMRMALISAWAVGSESRPQAPTGIGGLGDHYASPGNHCSERPKPRCMVETFAHGIEGLTHQVIIATRSWLTSTVWTGVQHQEADLAAGSGGACHGRERRGTPRPRPAGAEAARTASHRKVRSADTAARPDPCRL